MRARCWCPMRSRAARASPTSCRRGRAFVAISYSFLVFRSDFLVIFMVFVVASGLLELFC